MKSKKGIIALIIVGFLIVVGIFSSNDENSDSVDITEAYIESLDTTDYVFDDTDTALTVADSHSTKTVSVTYSEESEEDDKLTEKQTERTTAKSKTGSTTTKAVATTVLQSSKSTPDSVKIPSFGNSPYITINGNKPYFTSSEITTVAFERYSPLDSLGRCGVAFACIGKEIMPTGERGEIGQIKPTGWHTVKYDIVDGKYLYNRCHLIGWQLCGENANERNLITGTRYMNVEGMLPFENMVDDYIEETNNHVLYRVTPMYDGNNLLARGVQIEAYSVEDNGDGICFNVYCYNAQPGIKINYATGGSSLTGDISTEASSKKITTTRQTTERKTTTTTTTATTTRAETAANNSYACDYIININSEIFHNPTCSSVKRMNEENKSYFSGNRSELISNGYKPCQRCNP